MLIESLKLEPKADELERGLSPLLYASAFFVLTVSLLEPILSWVAVLALCSVGVRANLYFRPQQKPIAMRTVNLLAILAAVSLAWFSLSIGLLMTMVNLLVMGCAFKLMKINHEKDLKQLFATLVFLTACGFIFQQGIAYAFLYSIVALILLTALAAFHAPSMRFKAIAKLLMIQGAQAVPIAVLLFIVLPQLPPLWQMPTAKSAKTGLNDTVTPGDIAELSQSSDLAFRARFDTDLPAQHERYWRVMTLENFDGKTWSKSPIRHRIDRQYRQLNQPFVAETNGPFWRYDVITEPSHQRWLFSLDVPIAQSLNSNRVNAGYEYQLYASQPIVTPLNYSVSSYYQTPLNQTLYSVDRRINLQLPNEGNPRTRQWVEQLRQQYPQDRDFILAINRFLLDQGFRYTLQPDAMPTDPVDLFLFERQAGFCAHYASAFAYALRLGGIPARLVTGYQGGEEQLPGVVSVFQYDAHAWVEAWVDESGWQRFDPTALVSPGRIDFGLQFAMQDEGSFLADSPLSLARFKHLAALNQIRNWFANLDYQWSRFVLGFNRQSQQDILSRLFGELTTTRLSMIGVGVVLVIGALMLLYVLPHLRKTALNPITDVYNDCCALVATATGIERKHLGPNEYLTLVKSALSDTVYKQFISITQQYVENQYQANTNDMPLCWFKARRRDLKRQIQKSR